jgi:hypothetical protein
MIPVTRSFSFRSNCPTILVQISLLCSLCLVSCIRVLQILSFLLFLFSSSLSVCFHIHTATTERHKVVNILEAFPYTNLIQYVLNLIKVCNLLIWVCFSIYDITIRRRATELIYFLCFCWSCLRISSTQHVLKPSSDFNGTRHQHHGTADILISCSFLASAISTWWLCKRVSCGRHVVEAPEILWIFSIKKNLLR